MNKQFVVVTKTSASDVPVNHAARKRWIVVLLLAYASVSGVVACFLPEHDTPLDYLVGLPFLLLALSWCFVDANERDHRMSKMTRLLLVFVFIVGFPLYVLQTRRARGIETLVLAFVLIVVLFACFYVSYLAMAYAGESLGIWESQVLFEAASVH